MKINKAYCISRADYHNRMSQEYADDAETALIHSVGGLKDKHYEYFNQLSERHKADAEDWLAKSTGVGMS